MEKWFSTHSHCFMGFAFPLVLSLLLSQQPWYQIRCNAKAEHLLKSSGNGNHLEDTRYPMGFLRGSVHHTLSKRAQFARTIGTRVLFSLGQSRASVTQCHSSGSCTQSLTHPCTGTNTQRSPQPAGGGRIKWLFKIPNCSSSTNQPAV